MSRPPKVVLCVDRDQLHHAAMRFAMRTRGYRVLTAKTGVEALKILESLASETEQPKPVDAVVSETVLTRGMPVREMVERIHLGWPEVQVLLVSSTLRMNPDLVAERILPARPMPAEMLEQLRMVCARKRGPRSVGRSVHDLHAMSAAQSAVPAAEARA